MVALCCKDHFCKLCREMSLNMLVAIQQYKMGATELVIGHEAKHKAV